MGYLGAHLPALFSQIEEIFAKKGQEVIDKNKKAAQTGYDYILSNYPEGYNLKFPKIEGKDKLVMTGNDAVVLGAIAAECKFYAAYPMTPSTTILTGLAEKAHETGMVVKHAEDEISVINMATGASFAGVRSMVGSSGGGFALMVETVSLLGITETPLVIAEVQRPGPATGLPTWTEQGDLHFVIRSGHGEFPKIVLAPGDVLEAYRLTQEAFNLADIYQCPVFILSDKYLAEGFKSVEKSKIQNSKTQINRGKVIDNLQYKEGELVEFQRYIVTEDGISPRLVPGTKGAYFQANSYSHIADGHTTEEAESRKKQVDKLLKKTETYKKSHLPPPVLYGNPEAPLTIVSWGSMKGPVLQAMQDLPEFNLLHFTYIYPFSPQAESILRKAKKLLLLENNATGQLGELIAQETGIRIENKLLKYDGRPFYPEEVIEGIKSYL